MQVNLNTQNYSNSTGFTSLKKVNCKKVLSPLIGENEGSKIEDKIVANLNANPLFQTLCKKFNVFVNVTPHILGQHGILLDKGLSLEILAKKCGISGLFSKKETVTDYMAAGVEAQTLKLADHIIDGFINKAGEEGMEVDIEKFLNKTVSK